MFASSGFFYVSAEAVALVRARSRSLPIPHQPFFTQSLGSACAFIRPECPNHVFHLLFKLGVVALPAREIGGKHFSVKESGETRALNSNEKCGLMLGLVRRPGDKLTLLTKVFSMFDELSDQELLRQLGQCMNKPNRWLVIANVNGKPVVWPRREAVNGLRVQQRKALAAQAQ